MESKIIESDLLAKRQLFSSGKTLDLQYRIDALRKLKDIIVSSQNRILEALKSDLNKPGLEAYLSEVYFTVKEIDKHIKNIHRWAKPRKVKGSLLTFPSKSLIYNEPYGLALIIGPWNYPFQLMLAPVISAIAAGNCAVLKPSEMAPATSSVLKDIVATSLEKDHVSVIEGGVETSRQLLQSRFDYIFYTGSTKVGKIVMRSAAENLIPVTLELGGKNPCIVDKNTDLNRTVKRIAFGKFFNAGQTCVAPDYALVHKEIKDAFTTLIVETVRKFYGRNPVQSPDYARIINRKHYDRIFELIEEKGSVIGSHDHENLKITPVIIEDASWQDKCMKEEIFGPVLPVIEFEDIEEVIDNISSRPKPLSLYIFSDSKKFRQTLIASTSSGGICVNDTMLQILNLNLPFGGVGDSGMGSYHGKFGFDTFSHKKSVLIKKKWPDIIAQYPPYRDALSKIKKFLK